MKKIITVHYDKVESDRETGIYFSETSIVKNFRHKICSLEIPEKFPPTRSFPLNKHTDPFIEYLFQKNKEKKEKSDRPLNIIPTIIPTTL